MKFLVASCVVGLLSLLFGCGPRKSPFERKEGAWHYQNVPLSGLADAASFQPLDDYFGKDSKHAYYCTTERNSREFFTVKRARAIVLPGADVATFRILRSRYARDAQRAYHEGETFAVQDLNSFEVLEYNFARDRVCGYYALQQVAESDGPTFAGVDSRYARDKARVFYGDIAPGTGGGPVVSCVVVPGANPTTFAALDSGYAVDPPRAYYRGKLLAENAAGFQMLASGYAKSASQVFHDGKLLPEADAASFEMLDPRPEDADAKDARARYSLGRKVKPR